MSTKYDEISPFDESVREYFNQIDDMVSKAGLTTQVAPNSQDNTLQILLDGKCICTVDGQSGSMLYNAYPEIRALQDDIMNARIRIPFVSDMELEEQRLKALEAITKSEMEWAQAEMELMP